MSVLQERYLRDGPWTEPEFLALPEDRRVELLDGELLVSPSASSRHQRLSFRLCVALEAARPAGMEVLEAVNVRVGPDRILIPDLAIVTRPEEDIAVFDAADVLMLVEIASPSNVAIDRAIKPQLYAAAGIPYYVRIECTGPTALPHRLHDGRYIADGGGSVLRLQDPFPVEVDLPKLLGVRR
ncbi:MAG: Uma2 family endonuclease [Pseudonocardia sp.]|nr:Uma2 family endonuclease [Pseudonocardia sp.]